MRKQSQSKIFTTKLDEENGFAAMNNKNEMNGEKECTEKERLKLMSVKDSVESSRFLYLLLLGGLPMDEIFLGTQ